MKLNHFALLCLCVACGGTAAESNPADSDVSTTPETTTDDDCKKTAFYGDEDGDGFGFDDDKVKRCERPDGYVEAGGDCDDVDPTINPDALDDCDGIDNDCDLVIDEECGALCDEILFWVDPLEEFPECEYVWNTCDDGHDYELRCDDFFSFQDVSTMSTCECYVDGVLVDELTVDLAACGIVYTYQMEVTANEVCGFGLYDWSWLYQ